jgi:acetyltransferase EpsM
MIEDYVHISPQVTICDSVTVKEGTHIGAGATVIPNITIGKWCLIGAGAVITQNLPDYSLVVGVPGKVIRKLDQ